MRSVAKKLAPESVRDGLIDLEGPEEDEKNAMDWASENLEDFGPQAKRIPLPWLVKRRFLKRFLRDVHHYLFNVEHTPRPGETFKVRDETRQRFVSALRADGAADGPHIVVSHSMGTVIAYDCLKRVADCPHVDGLITIGSPLGIDEVQDKLRPGWSREDGFPSDKVGEGWVNVYGQLDVVAAADPKIRNDYKKSGSSVVLDDHQSNWGVWRHDITKYLAGDQLRTHLRAMLSGSSVGN